MTKKIGTGRVGRLSVTDEIFERYMEESNMPSLSNNELIDETRDKIKKMVGATDNELHDHTDNFVNHVTDMQERMTEYLRLTPTTISEKMREGFNNIPEIEPGSERGITITNVIDKVKEKTDSPVVIVGTGTALAKVMEELANMVANDSIVPIFKIEDADTVSTIDEENFLRITKEKVFNQLSISSEEFN